MPDQFDWRMVEREASPGRAVGRLLCDQREALGYSVADVAQRLRIRPAFIEAIESGRFDLLPGAAYIPAFLRAYATHVRLDPQKVLSAYQLSGAVPIERPVTLPTAAFPMVERRAPVGLAVLTVMLVVAAGYSVWRYMPVEQVTVAEKVPPVPDRLMASQPPAAPAAPEASAAPAAPAVETAIAPPAAPADAWPKTKPEAPKIDSAAAPMPAPAAAAPQTAVRASPTARRHGADCAAALCFALYDARSGPGGPTARPSGDGPWCSRGTQQATAIDPPRVDAVIPVKRDTLVSVKANSWVELRGPNGDVLAQTYVRAGESYTIPAGIAYSVTDAR